MYSFINNRTYKKDLFFLPFFLLLCSAQLIAQNYIQAKMGYVYAEYKTLNANFSERDEHDFLGGGMLDIEFGKEFGRKKVTFLLGGRVQYLQERLEGIYSEYQWNSTVKITVHAPAVLITGGIRVKLVDKLSTLLQANFGYKYILWYEGAKHKESFWNLYIPLSVSLNYKIKPQWSLISGLSFRPPVYTNQRNEYFIGFRKEFK